MSEEVFPSSVTEFDKPICRPDYVREQYGGEHAVNIGFNFSATACQERFNLAQDCICVPDPRIMIYSRELHIFRPLNVSAELSAMFDNDGEITSAMQDQS
ncbi:MAG: hypothetical protein ACAH24_12185, partial [Hyphomicrobiaceae bacterium]